MEIPKLLAFIGNLPEWKEKVNLKAVPTSNNLDIVDVGEALNMAHTNVIVHQRTGAGQIFLKGVVLDTVLIRPSAVQSGVGFQTHLIADHQVCPVAEEHFGAAGLAVGGDLIGNLVRHAEEVTSVHLIAVDVVAGGGLDVLERLSINLKS